MLELDVLIQAIRLEQAVGGSLREDHYSPTGLRDNQPLPNFDESSPSYKVRVEFSQALDIHTREIYLHANVSYKSWAL